MQLQRPVLKAKIWIAVIEKKPLYLQGRGLFPCSSSLFLEGKSAPYPFGALGLLGATQVEGEKEKNPLDPCRINLFKKEIIEKYLTCQRLVKKMRENHTTYQRPRKTTLHERYHRRQKETLNPPQKA